MSVLADKTLVRSAALARRAAVPAKVRASFGSALAIAGLNLIGARDRTRDSVASVFHPIRGEADTAPLLEALTRAGFATALPLTLGRERPLRFHIWHPGDPVAAGNWGIPEPLPSAPVVEPDVLFVPLAAFDRYGHRLGYGAGFYDNALAALRRSKPVLAIGVAFATQEVDAVPREPHDQPLDAVITERETILCGPR